MAQDITIEQAKKAREEAESKITATLKVLWEKTGLCPLEVDVITNRVQYEYFSSGPEEIVNFVRVSIKLMHP